MYLRPQLTFAFLVLLISAPLIAAQWDKKPPAQWSDKDSEKLLNSSPWSQTQTFTEIVQPTTDVRRDAPIGQSRVPDDVRVNFRVRFLTAKPIRLAAARLIELQQKGEMSQQQGADLKNFVEGQDPENIIVTVVIDTPRPSNKFSEARSVLSTMTTGALKQNTYLAVKGKRVFLKEYVPPRADGLGARFVFPRMVDGAPFITPEGGEIRFSADLPKGFALSQRFKPKDMMYEGKLEY
jgi:hypothetical protein